MDWEKYKFTNRPEGWTWQKEMEFDERGYHTAFDYFLRFFAEGRKIYGTDFAERLRDDYSNFLLERGINQRKARQAIYLAIKYCETDTLPTVACLCRLYHERQDAIIDHENTEGRSHWGPPEYLEIDSEE